MPVFCSRIKHTCLKAITSSTTSRIAKTKKKKGDLKNNLDKLKFVRWRRKPRWLPVAKSKMFRIPEHMPQTKEEKNELLRLHNNYRTQMRTIRQYLREENKRIAETSSEGHFVVTPEQEEEEFQRCLEINEKWNQDVAAIREERLKKQREEMIKYVEERKRLLTEQEEEKMEKIEALVRKQKEEAKRFITRENLEQAIEHALANPVDHNFALDLQGNMYKGRNNTPANKGPSRTPVQPVSEELQEAVN